MTTLCPLQIWYFSSVFNQRRCDAVLQQTNINDVKIDSKCWYCLSGLSISAKMKVTALYIIDRSNMQVRKKNGFLD